MHQALGLTGSAATMFAIMVALGIAGIAALFMALFWPGRWRLSYRMEIVFAAVLAAVAVYGDVSSADVYKSYESKLPTAGTYRPIAAKADTGAFDRTVTVYAYQWGFLFIETDGTGSRNALVAKPGERILLHVLSNDVIHGVDIPAARMITEVDPGSVRSIWIRAPERSGKYLIQCVDYCGIGHHQMKAWLVVKSAGAAPDSKPKHG